MHLSKEYKIKLYNFFSGKPVKKAYLFGSYARNEARNNSDIDILVELDYTQANWNEIFWFSGGN